MSGYNGRLLYHRFTRSSEREREREVNSKERREVRFTKTPLRAPVCYASLVLLRNGEKREMTRTRAKNAKITEWRKKGRFWRNVDNVFGWMNQKALENKNLDGDGIFIKKFFWHNYVRSSMNLRLLWHNLKLKSTEMSNSIGKAITHTSYNIGECCLKDFPFKWLKSLFLYLPETHKWCNCQ